MPIRDYAEFVDVTYRCRYLRPGLVTPPYRRTTYSLIEKRLEAARPALLKHVRMMARYRDRLLEIARSPVTAAQTEAHFGPEFSNWDACLMYALIRNYKPKKVIEVGSGNSTRWMRQAIIDEGLDTRIVVVDTGVKNPWTPAIADEIIPEHFEDIWDDSRLQLETGDMFFYDGSHFVVPGSDLMMFCLEYVPRLPAGVFLHFHDVFPPGDGPDALRQVMIFEAYLVYAMLLYGNLEWVCSVWPLRAEANTTLSKQATRIFPPFPPEIDVQQYGGSFWVQTPRQGGAE